MSTTSISPSARVSSVITGEMKSKIDRVWDAFWSGGISNPLEVIEQIDAALIARTLSGHGDDWAKEVGGGAAPPQGGPMVRHGSTRSMSSLGSLGDLKEVGDEHELQGVAPLPGPARVFAAK